MEYEKVIGLEIHVRIKSKTKMFCSCKNAVELETNPNVNVCPICTGFPGMLPTLNKEVVRLGVIGGLLMKCKINKISRFDRKSYFYPDLPAGFQTTQLYEPIVGAGSVKVLIDGKEKEFAIHHMHLENDAGKLSHAGGQTICDYNRAGSPLMEIVTEPVFHDKKEVMEFLKELQKIFRAGQVSDADMEKGQLRCDVNVSIRPKGTTKLGNRTEMKNLNSFSAIGRAIDSETKRQIKILEKGGTIDQETRGWDDDKGISMTQRTKEDAMDYRYFPEPDLMPIVLDDDFIEKCKENLPELPIEKRLRYLNEYNLKQDDARLLTSDKNLSDYFEKLLNLTKDPAKSCSYITTVLLALIKESEEINNIKELRFDIEQLAKIIKYVKNDELSSTNAKQVIEELFNNGGKADIIIEENNLKQTNDKEVLEAIVEEVIKNNAMQVKDYKNGNERIFGFFIGQCMKASKGQGNPKVFGKILKDKLK